MSEMQQLTVQPEEKALVEQDEVKIDPVDSKTKAKLLEWLCGEVRLLKYSD